MGTKVTFLKIDFSLKLVCFQVFCVRIRNCQLSEVRKRETDEVQLKFYKNPWKSAITGKVKYAFATLSCRLLNIYVI